MILTLPSQLLRLRTRIKNTLALMAGAFLVTAAVEPGLAQTNGAWNANAAGNWDDGGNWLGGNVATGAGSTADFTQVNLSAARIVTINGSVLSPLVGTFLIGDNTSAYFGYTVAGSNGGTLTFNNSGAGAALTQAANSGGNTFSVPVVLADNLAVTNNSSSAALTLSGGISGTGNLVFNDNNTAAVTVSTGVVNNSGTITNSGSGTGTVTISSNIGSNVTGIVQNGTSSLTISGANDTGGFAGTISVLKGTLSLGSTGATGNGTSAISLGNTSGSESATLSIGASTTRSIDVLGGNTGTSTISVGSFTLSTSAGSQTTIYGSHTLSVNLAANANSRMLQRIAESGGSSALAVSVTGSKFNAAQFGNSANSYSGGTTLNGAGYMSIASGGSGSWFGTGPLTINLTGGFNQQNTTATVTGISQLILNSDAEYSGGSSGIGLSFSAPVNLGATGSATARTLNVSSILTLNGAISDGTNATTKGIVKTGSGLLSLGGLSTYTGDTVVNAGVLQLAVGDDRLPTNTTLVVNAGSTAGLAGGQVDLNNRNQTVAALTAGSGVGGQGIVTNGSATSGTRTLTVANSSTSQFDGLLINSNTGALALVKNGGGNLILTGGHSFTGGTTVNAGTLTVTGTATNATANVLTGSASSGSFTITGLSSTAGLVVGQRISGTNIAAGSYITSIVNGTSVAISKVTTGTISAAALNFAAYSGNGLGSGSVTVNGGAFIVNGSLAATSAVSVASGGTLGGSGTINSAVSIASGGALSPGNSPGLLTVNNNLALNTGSAFQFELTADSTSGRGTSFDGVDVTGAGVLSIQTGVISNLIFNGSGSSVDFTGAFWDSNQDWLVFGNANAAMLSSLNVFDTINISNDSLGSPFSITGGTFSFSTSGNNIYLNYNVVPEPSTWALLSVGLAGFLMRRRSRRVFV